MQDLGCTMLKEPSRPRGERSKVIFCVCSLEQQKAFQLTNPFLCHFTLLIARHIQAHLMISQMYVGPQGSATLNITPLSHPRTSQFQGRPMLHHAPTCYIPHCPTRESATTISTKLCDIMSFKGCYARTSALHFGILQAEPQQWYV